MKRSERDVLAVKMGEEVSDRLLKVSFDFRKAYAELLTEKESLEIDDAFIETVLCFKGKLNKFKRGLK